MGVSLVAAAVLLAAGPGIVLREWLRPEPWNALNLRIRFRSMRYERAALVFTYRLENHTGRSERLTPGGTTLRLVQSADQPPVGYPMMNLPLEIQAHASCEVELRLELAVPRQVLTPQQSEEQTARVLQHALPDASSLESPLSPLPMSTPSAPPESAVPVSAEPLLSNALITLNGFELVDRGHGIRILFPRGW